VEIRHTKGGGSGGSSLSAEMLLQESFSMDSRGKGRIQENEKDRYDNHSPATAPKMLVGIS
jgi:hypothetical protein